MGDKEDEAKTWASQQNVADAAITFANRFLGLRKGGADVKLAAADLARFLDIVRAVSWVESRHGTGSGNQPARDQMQCANPGDVWWRELTGQTAETDRFVRGGTLNNLDADELPAAAASTRRLMDGGSRPLAAAGRPAFRLGCKARVTEYISPQAGPRPAPCVGGRPRDAAARRTVDAATEGKRASHPRRSGNADG